jgi:phosphatidylglycerophosphatase A
VILWFITIHLTRASYHAQIIGTLVAALIVTRIGIPAATVVARESGREDPGHVVIDEVAGQLFALIAIPADWPHALVGLLLFRIFDILKPPPVRQLERLPAGTGIMLDDVAAGLMALAVGHLILHFF